MADSTLINNNESPLIESVDSATDSTQQPRQQTPDRGQFEAAMQKDLSQTTSVNQSGKASLLDVARESSPLNAATQANKANLIAQTQEAISKIEEIKKTLKGQRSPIKSSAAELLQRKLEHIDESLKRTLKRTGIESPIAATPEVAELKTRTNPVERFLGYLTDGQHQLETLGQELQVLGENRKQLTPVDMLAIQFKMGQIQQELELFTSLLNKALESIKTIMNIQV